MPRPEPRYVAVPTGFARVFRVSARCPTTDGELVAEARELIWSGDGHDDPAATVYCLWCRKRHALRWPAALDELED